MTTLVFNGWAAGPETWELCTFRHDWVFDYVEQLDGLPEKVIEDFDEVVLVGFSMGGSSALRMMLRHPEKVRGMVLVSSSPCMMEERRNNGDGTRGEVVWRGMSRHRLDAFRFGTRMIFADDPSPVYDPVSMDRGIEYLLSTDIRSELLKFSESEDNTNFPVSIFQSECDGIVKPNNAEFLKRVFPHARLTMIPGCEHVLPVTIPELIDEAVTAIVNSTRRGE